MNTSISAFNQTLEKSHLWLKELKKLGHFTSEEEAYTALRAVLHSLRDRLLINEAVHLASELPMLIRGMYYESWKPSLNPTSESTPEELIATIKTHLRNANNRIEAEFALESVFRLLKKKISAGEIDDLKSQLPNEIAAMWQ